MKALLIISALSLAVVNSGNANVVVHWSVPSKGVGVSSGQHYLGSVDAYGESGTVNLHLGVNSVSEFGYEYDFSNTDPGNYSATFNLSRPLTLNGVTKTLIQTGSWDSSMEDYPNVASRQFYSVNPGYVQDDYLLSGYKIQVSVPANSGGGLGDEIGYRWYGNATFTVRSIPDTGSTLGLMGLGLLGVCALKLGRPSSQDRIEPRA